MSLAIEGIVTAEVLKGGLTGAQLFLVAAGQAKYVVRFLHNEQKNIEYEFYCLETASKEGYGPHLYFADVKQAVAIMEYLPGKKIDIKDRQSKELYKALGSLMRKIHQSPGCVGAKNRFAVLRGGIKWFYAKGVEGIPITSVENLLTIIEDCVSCCTTHTLCHNDLNPNNLLFLNDEFKAIDYEACAIGDPYFDVATVAIFFCFSPWSEKELLAAYLERQPSEREWAHLYLMKQVAWINYSLIFLKITHEKLHLYKSMQVPVYEDLLAEMFERKIDFKNPEHRIKYAKIVINHVIANAETQEFNDALRILKSEPSANAK